MTHPTHHRNMAHWIQLQVLVQETRDDGVKGPTESKMYTPAPTHTHTHTHTHTWGHKLQTEQGQMGLAGVV